MAVVILFPLLLLCVAFGELLGLQGWAQLHGPQPGHFPTVTNISTQ